MLPGALPQRGIRRGDVQAFGADHQPVQADELKAFTRHDVAILAPLGRGDGGRRLGQRERRDFYAGVARFADGFAGIGKGPLVESLVAGGVAKNVRHERNSVAQRLTVITAGPRLFSFRT